MGGGECLRWRGQPGDGPERARAWVMGTSLAGNGRDEVLDNPEQSHGRERAVSLLRRQKALKGVKPGLGMIWFPVLKGHPG